MDNGDSSSAQIKYCSLEDGSIKEIEELVLDGFVKDENTLKLARNCEGGQVEDHRAWVKEIIPAHNWAVSRLAVDAATGRVAGVCLCDVATVDQPSLALDAFIQTETEASRAVYSFLGQMMEGYDIFKVFGITKVLCLNMVTVDARYRRLGISLELRRQSLELARQAGCQAVVNQATSPYTRKALVKLGFKQEKFLPYNESVMAHLEKVDVSGCGPEDGGALMVLRL